MHFRPFSGSFIPFFRISKPDFKPFNPCLRPHKHKESGCVISHIQYALKGQKHLAQGIALGFRTNTKKSP